MTDKKEVWTAVGESDLRALSMALRSLMALLTPGATCLYSHGLARCVQLAQVDWPSHLMRLKRNETKEERPRGRMG